MPQTPNLREWNPKESDAKFVMDTNMLDTTAKESSENQSGTNKNEEKVNPSSNFGNLGAKGRN